MGDVLTRCEHCGSFDLTAVKVTSHVRRQRGDGYWGPELVAKESYLLMCETCGEEVVNVNARPSIPGWDFPKITCFSEPEPRPFMVVDGDKLSGPLRLGEWIECPNCGKHHEVHGSTDLATGETSDMILAVKCDNGKSYVVGVGGQRIR